MRLLDLARVARQLAPLVRLRDGAGAVAVAEGPEARRRARARVLEQAEAHLPQVREDAVFNLVLVQPVEVALARRRCDVVVVGGGDGRRGLRDLRRELAVVLAPKVVVVLRLGLRAEERDRTPRGPGGDPGPRRRPQEGGDHCSRRHALARRAGSGCLQNLRGNGGFNHELIIVFEEILKISSSNDAEHPVRVATQGGQGDVRAA